MKHLTLSPLLLGAQSGPEPSSTRDRKAQGELQVPVLSHSELTGRRGMCERVPQAGTGMSVPQRFKATEAGTQGLNSNSVMGSGCPSACWALVSSAAGHGALPPFPRKLKQLLASRRHGLGFAVGTLGWSFPEQSLSIQHPHRLRCWNCGPQGGTVGVPFKRWGLWAGEAAEYG